MILKLRIWIIYRSVNFGRLWPVIIQLCNSRLVWCITQRCVKLLWQEWCIKRYYINVYSTVDDNSFFSFLFFSGRKRPENVCTTVHGPVRGKRFGGARDWWKSVGDRRRQSSFRRLVGSLVKTVAWVIYKTDCAHYTPHPASLLSLLLCFTMFFGHYI